MNRQLVLLFIAMGLGVFMQTMDITAMNVALPTIENDFDSSLTTIEWVISSYLLAYSVFLVTGGRLADMFGRRKLFFISLVIFSTSSLLGAVAQSDWWLITARTFQGIGAAIMWPSIIGIINAYVPDDKKGISYGLILGAGGLGQSIGPIAGGAFAELLSWRWILLINIPLSLLTAFITFYTLKIKDEKTVEEKIDYAGIATLSIGLAVLLYTLNQSSSWGLVSPYTIALLILSIVLLWIFLRIEKKVPSALVPLDVMQNKQFIILCIVIALFTPAGFAALLYLPRYMQQFLEFSTFMSGLGLVPAMALWALSAPFAGLLYNRFGPRILAFIASVLIGLAAFIFSTIGIDSSYISLVPGLMFLGMGLGIGFSTLTTAAVSSVSKSRSSLAGALIHMCQLGGGVIGLVVSITIFTYVSKNSLIKILHHAGIILDDKHFGVAKNYLAGLGSKSGLMENLTAETGKKIILIVQDSFILGLHDAMLFVSVLALSGAVISLIFIRGQFNKNIIADKHETA